MGRTVGLVVPAFRPDVDALGTYVRELEARLEPAAIRVELDDPSPGTVDRLADLPATVNAVPARRGKGAAITAGFCALETDVVAFADADGSTAVESVASIVDRVRDGDADLAIGTRRRSDSEVVTTQSPVRERLGDGFAWLARRLLSVSVTDYQCGAKAIDRTVWTDVGSRVRESGFAWDVELVALADALGYRVVEVPVRWVDAPGSTVAPIPTAVELAIGLARARHRSRRARGDRFHATIARGKPEPPTVMDTLGIDIDDD
jgi:hypothetical protein